MNTRPDTEGQFGVRLYFEPVEFEQMMDGLRLRTGPDAFQEGTGVDVDLVLLKAFEIEADYVDLPPGVLGRTLFNSDGRPRVEVSRELEEASFDDGLARRRLRTTLAHETGHVACHASLFIEDTETMSLFPDDIAAKKKNSTLCRDESVGVFDQRRYRGEWWEYQANQCMAALLLPRRLFREKTGGALEAMGVVSFGEAVRMDRSDEVVRSLANCFDVSQEAIYYRLKGMGYVPDEEQKSLAL